MSFPDEVVKVAVEAASVISSSFHGVDVIFDEEGNHMIPEINYPFNFSSIEKYTGFPVARKIIKTLQDQVKYSPSDFTADWPSKENPPHLLLMHSKGANVKMFELLKKAATFYKLPVLEIDTNMPLPDLPSDKDYLLYRIGNAGFKMEKELFQKYTISSFGDDYPVYSQKSFKRYEHLISIC